MIVNGAEVDPFETPVWALYGDENGAQIIHGCLPRYQDTRNLPTRMWGEGGRWTSRTGRALTREKLVEDHGIREACSHCGSPFSTSYCEPTATQLKERNLCFYCNHWLHTVKPNYGKPGHIVVNGTTYSFDPEKPMVRITNDGQFYGHGGREFNIKLASGELVKTNNLWCGGRIPDRFIKDMPDNAEFVRWPDPVGHGCGFLG